MGFPLLFFILLCNSYKLLCKKALKKSGEILHFDPFISLNLRFSFLVAHVTAPHKYNDNGLKPLYYNYNIIG
jgi:hypothetical protein